MGLYRYRIIYSFVGLLLAQGAPLGALLIKFCLCSLSSELLWEELQQNIFFYFYMFVSTSIAFTIYGFVLGRTTDILVQEKQLFYEKSITDPLTGLFNRRYFEQVIKQEFSRSKRFKTSVSCLMLDIDFFKKVNDAYGHVVGDKVLKNLAELLQNLVREYDTVARYGGEEFVILLPNTSSQEALSVAEKIRAGIEQYDLLGNLGLQDAAKITVSVGGASFCQEHLETPQSLISKADTALYRSKEKGRNRVTI